MEKLNWVKRACGAFLMCIATTMALPAQSFTTLHTFDGTDGANPFSRLLQATNGNLYGTTFSGGASGAGTIFQMTSGGVLTTLYGFCSQPGCTDGQSPAASLIQASDGNLYGTTAGGGTNGLGTIFRITPGGTLTTLHSFDLMDGGLQSEPTLTQGMDGSFYGTTVNGGTSAACSGTSGCGTVFKMTSDGTLTTLYSFCSLNQCQDGVAPYGALVQAANGDFYGTTAYGGVYFSSGTLFKITTGGTLTKLHDFCSQPSCADGAYPLANLTQGGDGNFYGVTYGGGGGNAGVIFKITPAGMLTTLHTFCPQSGCTDGSQPVGGLVEGSDGNLYGTTGIGGLKGVGTLFKIRPDGTLTTAHSFDYAHGISPLALIQDTDGSFYGVTEQGGSPTSTVCTKGCGTVFSLSEGLAQFVETQPGFGQPGTVVNILGTNLTGATDVTFAGTAVQFIVASDSLIRTHVPEGAATGTVQVTTPAGIVSSNVLFRVLP